MKQRRWWRETNTEFQFCQIETQTWQKSIPVYDGISYISHIIKTWRPNEPGYRTHDAHTAYHIKGVVIWALGPKATNEIMRGQLGRDLKDVNLPELLKLFKKTFIPAQNVFHSRVVKCNMNQKWRNKTSERNTFQEILSPEKRKAGQLNITNDMKYTEPWFVWIMTEWPKCVI